MTVGSKEYYEMLSNFEKHYTGRRFDKESAEFQKSGNIYQDGEVNNLFLAFRLGYSYARAVYQDGGLAMNPCNASKIDDIQRGIKDLQQQLTALENALNNKRLRELQYEQAKLESNIRIIQRIEGGAE